MSKTSNASIPHAMELRGSQCKFGFPQRQNMSRLAQTDSQENFLYRIWSSRVATVSRQLGR